MPLIRLSLRIIVVLSSYVYISHDTHTRTLTNTLKLQMYTRDGSIVFASHSEYMKSSPWQRKSQYQTTSSGFIISNRLIITNAHSVLDPVLVQVRRCGDDTKYEASVVCIGEECDLALITVKDESFWQVKDQEYKGQSHPYAVQFGR